MWWRPHWTTHVSFAGARKHLLDLITQICDADRGSLASRFRSDLDVCITGAQEKLYSYPPNSVPAVWRQLYCDSCIARSLLDLLLGDVPNQECPLENKDAAWLDAVSRIDMALITSGAPGQGRLDMIYDLIQVIQRERLPSAPNTSQFKGFLHPTAPATRLPTGLQPVPRLSSPPSMSAFRQHFRNTPFILSSYITDWPALTNHPWSNPTYLCEVAGRGRVVPVEVGSDYTRDDWSQRIMGWEDFLRTLSSHDDNSKEKLYLAQHNLLTQFPALRSDIIPPDYVYSSPPPPEAYPQYRPPSNEEELVINAWIGPSGTLSPGHTDPYYNCYGQVVGYKTVWLAPPSATSSMYPHGPGSNLTNTSQVPIFDEISTATGYPLFHSNVLPKAMMATLEPGDLLFFPPGWWHAMRSETTSFSVSMWF